MDVAMVAKGLIEAFDSATQIPLNETNQLIQKKEMSAGNEFLEENKKKEGVQITSYRPSILSKCRRNWRNSRRNGQSNRSLHR